VGLAKCGDHIGKDVLNLVSHGQQNHYDHDRNEDQNQRVLNHSLAMLPKSIGPHSLSHFNHLLVSQCYDRYVLLNADRGLDGRLPTS
jgi:hypothetical protein